VVISTAEYCESCGREAEPGIPAKTLEGSFANDERKRLCLCLECFGKRYKVITKKLSGYGGTIYELDEKATPRFGMGSKKFTCLRCEWVAWTEEGLAAHSRKKHGQSESDSH
jgi:hypothetical protein